MDNQNNSDLESCAAAGNTIAAQLEQMIDQAKAIGPYTGEYMSKLIKSVRFKAPMLSACTGILRLARVCGKLRIEAACSRALQGSKYNLRIIKHILDNNLEAAPLTDPTPPCCTQTKEHENLRGEHDFT